MTPKYRLVPETPSDGIITAMHEAGSSGPYSRLSATAAYRVYAAMLSAAPPMDYISGEEIRKLVKEMRTKANSTHSNQFKLRTAYAWCANELEKLLKGEGQ